MCLGLVGMGCVWVLGVDWVLELMEWVVCGLVNFLVFVVGVFGGECGFCGFGFLNE